MPSPMQGFLDTFFQVENVRLQRQQQQLAERQEMTQRAATAANIGQMIADPEGRQALGQAMFDSPELAAMVGDVAPSAAAIASAEAEEGLEAMPEEQREGVQEAAGTRAAAGMAPGQLAQSLLQGQLMDPETTPEGMEALGEAARAQAFAGMSPGQLSVDVQIADLPEEEQEAAARIQTGLELDAMQTEQVAQWAAQNNLQMQDLAQRGALGTVNAMLQAQQIEQQMLMAMMQGQEQQMVTPNQAIEAIQRSMAALEEGPETDMEFATHSGIVNNMLDQLAMQGIIPGWDEEGNPVFPRMSPDPDEMRPGRIQRIIRGLWGESGPGPTGWGIGGGAVIGGAIGTPFGMTVPGAALGATVGGIGMGLAGTPEGGLEQFHRQMPPGGVGLQSPSAAPMPQQQAPWLVPGSPGTGQAQPGIEELLGAQGITAEDILEMMQGGGL